MSSSVETMENSNVLRELANFDIKAPISISISFEDDFDETPIKKEIETDDYQENQETANSAFIPILEPKTEIESDSVTPCILTKEQINDFTAHDNIQDTSALQPQSQLLISETLRKRKSVDVQMCKPKKTKTISDTADKNSRDDEISSRTFGNHTKENNIQSGPSLTTSENAKNTTCNESQMPHQFDQNLNGLHQTDLDKINAYITNCLSLLSENMRLIMQAYGAHRRQQISKEDYINIKLLHFNSSYKTVVTMLVTQEDNNEFISTFLEDTLRRALKKSSFFIHTYQDYANLLVEMIAWSKREQRLTHKLSQKSEQLIPVQIGVITEPQVNKNPAQGSIQGNNSNTEGEKVCIFSSGPPERALSINIDPRLNAYLQTTAQNDSAVTNHQPLRGTTEYDGDMTQGKAAVDCLARYVANHNKPTHQSVIQSTSPQTPNLVTNHPQHHMQPLNSSSYMMKNIPNYSIPSQQMRDRTPVLRMQLGKATLQSNLRQPVDPQRPPPRYGHSAPHTQSSTPPPAYGQSRHLQTQSGPQQHLPPQFYQVPVLPKPTQFQQSQYLQTQLGPQYVQPQQLESHLPVLEHNQTRQPQVSISQQVPQQYTQQPHPKTTELWPSLVEMLSTESTAPLPYPSNEQTQSALSGQLQSRNQQPPPAYRTEWQQGQNANFQAGQVPQQTQKGSSRSASTDSGFTSPLNFNVSTDQTMPTMPQEPESTMPMIVHVTSLSNKASYVKLGKCVVCKKSTKQMCMGCMNIYYCNYECQSVDWTAHAPNCSQQNTN